MAFGLDDFLDEAMAGAIGAVEAPLDIAGVDLHHFAAGCVCQFVCAFCKATCCCRDREHKSQMGAASFELRLCLIYLRLLRLSRLSTAASAWRIPSW